MCGMYGKDKGFYYIIISIYLQGWWVQFKDIYYKYVYNAPSFTENVLSKETDTVL